jgi:hypothetical protein
VALIFLRQIDPDIKPEDILPRRTRGKKVDYTSPEALQKAGLDPESHHEEDEEEFHDDAMKE